MARVRRRRRRTTSRGRGGRFVSRRSRRRRRNPVVPVSWNPGRRRRRRSRSRRRNPLFLSRKGFSRRKHRGYRRLRMKRRAPRHWHNNPVVPVSWNPRRRRRSGRRRTAGRRRRSYRNNPVLPFFAFNPGGGAGPVGAVMARAKSLIDVRFWTETGVPVTVGFFASKSLGGLLHAQTLERFAGIGPTSAYFPYTKALADTVAGAGLAWLVGRFYNKKAGDSVWLGTVVNVAAGVIKSVLNQFAPAFAASIGMSGLGDDLSDRMKEAVTNRVRQSLGSYLTRGALARNTARPMGTYATVSRLNSDTYDPSPRGDLRDYDVASNETSL